MKHRKKHGTKIIVVLLVLGGSIASYLFSKWINAPVSQSVNIESDTSMMPASYSYKPVDTTFYKTKINEDYRVRTAKNPNQSDLLQIILFDATGSRLQVGITTNKLPAGGITEVGDYIFRSRSPEYERYKLQDMHLGGMAFKKSDDSELSLYITSPDGRYASITVTGPPGQLYNLSPVMKTVTEDWVWKNQSPQ